MSWTGSVSFWPAAEQDWLEFQLLTCNEVMKKVNCIHQAILVYI